MKALDKVNSIPIPDGPWKLDIEPGLEEQTPSEFHPHESQESRSITPLESTTPPSLHHILEALLFVATEPLSSEHVCSMIRGLAISQLEEALRSMNLHYRRQGRPYSIEKQQAGYHLVLRTPFRNHLEELYGGVKEVRFSQLAIETLAIIAYRQPFSQVQVEGVLGQNAGLPLRQLIRRGMVQLQGTDDNDQPNYVTTARFLNYFSLNRIEDLPKADDLERL